MINTTAPTERQKQAHRVECRAGRPKLISNIFPEEGYTAWCQRCQLVHEIAWQDQPIDVLQRVHEAIGRVLGNDTAREEAKGPCVHTPLTPTG